MSNVSFVKKREALRDYYKGKGLLIVGLNDSQGVNTTSTVFKKGLLEYLVQLLKSDALSPEVINAFSLMMNKTEHVDYFLKNNLSLEEIKLSQIYSAVGAITKVMTDLGLPKAIGSIGNIYRLVYKIKSEDENIRISSAIRDADEPVLIYSYCINDYKQSVIKASKLQGYEQEREMRIMAEHKNETEVFVKTKVRTRVQKERSLYYL